MVEEDRVERAILAEEDRVRRSEDQEVIAEGHRARQEKERLSSEKFGATERIRVAL